MENRKPERALRSLAYVGGGAALILLMLYMGGVFTPGKIRPGRTDGPQAEKAQPPSTARASLETVTEHYESVGTVRPKTETRVEAQVMGRVLEVLVRPGDRVSKGQPLVILDSRELGAGAEQADQGLASARSRREQAEQARLAAKAEFLRAEAAFKRSRTYFEAKAATAQDREQAEATYLQARARLEQSEGALNEADSGVKQAVKGQERSRIALGYTRIAAPDSGEVAKRMVEPGDLAAPGRPLLLLQTRGMLRLEALVPESLIHRLRVGASLGLRIDALGKALNGRVEEVVPSADPVTRAILVKVTLPDDPELYPGMFGKLLIPLEDRRIVLIPKRALQRVGQLEMVTVEQEGRWQRVYVKTGRAIGERVEILSGLKGNENLALVGDGNA